MMDCDVQRTMHNIQRFSCFSNLKSRISDSRSPFLDFLGSKIRNVVAHSRDGVTHSLSLAQHSRREAAHSKYSFFFRHSCFWYKRYCLESRTSDLDSRMIVRTCHFGTHGTDSKKVFGLVLQLPDKLPYNRPTER